MFPLKTWPLIKWVKRLYKLAFRALSDIKHSATPRVLYLIKHSHSFFKLHFMKPSPLICLRTWWLVNVGRISSAIFLIQLTDKLGWLARQAYRVLYLIKHSHSFFKLHFMKPSPLICLRTWWLVNVGRISSAIFLIQLTDKLGWLARHRHSWRRSDAELMQHVFRGHYTTQLR